VRVLVTGGTSLLGRTVACFLRDRGDEVTVFQRSPSGLGTREHLGDVADEKAVRVAVAGADAVVHLAARVAVTGPWEPYFRTNFVGTENVVTAAGEAGAGRFVHVSSPSVAYHGAAIVGAPTGPADPARARGHYARSKAMAEVAALALSSEGFAVVAVRPHLVWGPGDTQLVGRIVERARQRRLTLVGTGLALVDTTYLTNAADAIVAALDRAPELAGRALVVSNGQPRTVKELFSRMAAAAGLDPPRLTVPLGAARAAGAVVEQIWDRRGRTDDPPMTTFAAEQLATAHWFDQRETRRLLRWTPAVSLDEGFRRLEAYFAGRA
jgi:nucleoside-diphosphate-sugar epimerase